jgi:hypothetical protein
MGRVKFQANECAGFDPNDRARNFLSISHLFKGSNRAKRASFATQQF